MSEVIHVEEKETFITKLVPFSMTVGIIILDQVTKLLVIMFLPLYKSIKIIGDLLILRHVRNTAVAFGIGRSLPMEIKQVLFLVLPIIVIVFLIVFIIRAKDLLPLQRWVLCAIVGGGVGNIIDRIIRPDGVVDFVDMKFFGIFGLERWPTYNVADSTIVIGVTILIISMIIFEIKLRKKGVVNE